jgi:hypothetical protein
MHTYEMYKGSTELYVYNDDGVQGCIDSISDYISFDRQQAWYARYGREVTTGKKDTNGKVNSVCELSFLKKTPLLVNGVYLPQPDPDTICGMYNWYRKSAVTKDMQIASNFNDILRMKFFQGRNEFGRARNILLKCIPQSRQFNLLTYDKLLQEWNTKNMIGDFTFGGF